MTPGRATLKTSWAMKSPAAHDPCLPTGSHTSLTSRDRVLQLTQHAPPAFWPSTRHSAPSSPASARPPLWAAAAFVSTRQPPFNSKSNSDGSKKEGITFPSGEVQARLLREVYNE